MIDFKAVGFLTPALNATLFKTIISKISDKIVFLIASSAITTLGNPPYFSYSSHTRHKAPILEIRTDCSL